MFCFICLSLYISNTCRVMGVDKILGPLSAARVGAVLSILLLITYPVIALLRGVKLIATLAWVSTIKNVLSVSIATGLSIMQNRAVSQHQRGAANGISVAAISCFKADVKLVLSSAELRHGESFLHGAQMIFFLLILIEFVGLMLTFQPFLVPPKET